MQGTSLARRIEGLQVEPQVRDLQQLAATPAAGARDECFEPDFQLGKVERLGQIVVGSRTEAGDLVGQFVPRAEHQHRRITAGFAKILQESWSVKAWEHPVEHHHVEALGHCQMQAGQPIGRRIEHVAPRLEILEEVRHEVSVVFNYQDAHAYASPSFAPDAASILAAVARVWRAARPAGKLIGIHLRWPL